MKRMNCTVRLIPVAASILIACFSAFAGAAYASPQVANKTQEEMKQLVVMVSGKLGGAPTIGAGIIIGVGTDRLYIATADHVVRRGIDEAQGLRVELRSMPGEPMEAKLLTRPDDSMDLAVLAVKGVKALQIPIDALPFEQLGDSKALKRGDPVYFVGQPHGKAWRVNLSADKISGKQGDMLYFESTSIGPGLSGGGLFNDRGQLVGMIQNDQPPDGVAVSIEKVLETLSQQGYPVGLKIKEKEPPISGEWATDILTNRVDEKATYRLFFTFEVQGDSPLGTVRRVSTRSDDRYDYGIKKGIVDGKITGNTISFYLPYTYTKTETERVPSQTRYRIQYTSTTVSYRVAYHGTVSHDQIHFTRQDDRGYPPERFTAERRSGTPLHEAVSERRPEHVKRLLEAGVNVNATDNFGDTPLLKAVRARRDIYKQQQNRAKELGELLHIVKLLVDNGADVNVTDIVGATPLHIALLTRYQDLEVAKVLLSGGANPNGTSEGRSFLCMAQSKGQVEVVKLLLEAKADPDMICGRRDGGPLHEAVEKSQSEIVKLLLGAGANVELAESEGNTPLLWAVCFRDQTEMVELLLKAGANVNATNNSGITPLHRAESEEMAKLFLEAGAEVNATSNRGKTPLYFAASRGQLETVKLLLEAGADVNPTGNSWTPLHNAVSRQGSETVRLLLEAGADVNAADKRGYTALRTAVDEVNKEILRLLLEAGADVNAADKRWNTPLHIAASKSGYEAVEIVKLLILKGADVNAKNSKLETPLSIALREKTDVARLLRSHGGVE